jgi:hypothetical protein
MLAADDEPDVRSISDFRKIHIEILRNLSQRGDKLPKELRRREICDGNLSEQRL